LVTTDCERSALFAMAAARGSRMKKSAPDKGSFPLDHGGQCQTAVRRYLDCLKEGDNAHRRCTELTKEYLRCRMDRNLMKREPLSALGFGSSASPSAAAAAAAAAEPAFAVDVRAKEKVGFISGLGVKPLGGAKLGWSEKDLARQQQRRQHVEGEHARRSRS